MPGRRSRNPEPALARRAGTAHAIFNAVSTVWHFGDAPGCLCEGKVQLECDPMYLIQSIADKF